ncbi:MAG: NHL repeat-containing protein [Nitrospinae bacterium]|nr:NHL repeat-containing protein [Nitrospinota bacterium]
MDQAVKSFIERYSGNASSPAAREFLDAFEESAASSDLSESEKAAAQSQLEALRATFSARFENAFRPAPEKKTDLSPPSGMALAPDGSLVVSDDFNHRVQIYDRDGTLVRQFGGKGKNPGQLTYPKGLTTDPDGNIYVADSWNHRVQKFDPLGNPLLSFGGYGEARGQMNEPYDVHIDPMGNLVVVERYNHRLQFFSPDGKSLGWLGNRGTTLEARLAWLYDTPPNLLDPAVFEFPTSIARDGQNAYYVADSGNHRIVKFDPEWRQVQTWGGRGAGPGQFQYPLCVTVDPEGRLFVADLNNDRVQAFTSQGQFLFALAEAGASTPLKMPGLTLAGPGGTLYIALTFDTRILRFKTPLQPQEAILENQVRLDRERGRALFALGQLYEECGDPESAARKYEASFQALLEERAGTGQTAPSDERKNLPPALNRLAAMDSAGKNEDLLLKGLGLIDDLLRESRQNVLSCLREWENAGSEFLQRLFARETAILQETEDPRVFDRAFYLAEKTSKERYREIRELFHDYRAVAEKFGEYAFALLSRPLSADGNERLRQTLARRLDDIRETIDLHIDKKEKNEEAMVQTFSAQEGDGKKWEEFRLKFHANVQLLDALKHFHFELRVHLKMCKAALLNPANAPAFAEFLKETFATPEGSRPLGRVLLRTQEDWGDHSGLNTLFLDLMDTALRLPESGGPRKRALQSGGFSPLSFDSEDMDYEDIFRSLAMEGTPMRQTPDGLLCGGEIYAPWDGDVTEMARRLDEILQYQNAYEEKNVELFAELERLRLQRLDLDDDLRKADTRDPKAPIPIGKTSQAVDFQINLVRRMLMTLRINEARNLSRLTLGGAAFSSHPAAQGNPLLKTFLGRLREYYLKLGSEIDGLHEQRKSRYMEIVSLENQAEELGANLVAGNFEKSLSAKRGVASAQWAFEQAQFNLDRRYRTRNFLRKSLRLAGDAAFGPFDPETQGAGLKLKRHFGRRGPPAGKFIFPLGLAYARNGDLLAADHNGNSICRFSGEGIFKSSFGRFGNSFGAFQYPASVAEDSQGNILVADSHNVRVQKFTAEGKFILAFGDRGGQEEKTATAFSLAVDREDNVWIADTVNHRLLVFNPEGQFVRSIRQGEESPESLTGPTCVHCLEDGGYIVADRSESPLKRFDAKGNLLCAFKRGTVSCGDIFYIAVHPESGVFAADSWNNQILRLNGQLELVCVYNDAGRRAGNLGIVGGLAIHGSSLAVANHDGNKIQIFELA